MMRKTLLVVSLMVMVLAVDSIADVNVLVLTGNRAQAEFPVLETFTDVGGETVTYEQTRDLELPGLNNAGILWIGQGEICENAYFFNAATEDKIKSFVEAGGIVISVGQDSDGGRPCEVGWITAPTVGIERGGVETFEVTDAPEVGDLFTNPNNVNAAHSDDAWTQPDSKYILLSTINSGQDVGVGLLRHGSGWYILTSIENENAGDVSTNAPLMENLIHYAVNLSQTTAVEYGGKLSISWGKMKAI